MAKRLPAGEFRHRVTIKEHKIESSSTQYDSYGQLSTSSTARHTGIVTRAKIEELSGNELEIARQRYANARYQVTIDYNATLDSTGGSRREIVFGNRTLHIGAVMNTDMENVELVLLCGSEK